uniref:Uncharacterized protein n=1 Tax=Pithovirus LCDPAC01 TaxID=2506600 RepID=A0A481YP49_9VIRU|nr:MAG: hypothetical protein LCDPAC01_00630 [Pithovirus LCDPAC01]
METKQLEQLMKTMISYIHPVIREKIVGEFNQIPYVERNNIDSLTDIVKTLHVIMETIMERRKMTQKEKNNSAKVNTD